MLGAALWLVLASASHAQPAAPMGSRPARAQAAAGIPLEARLRPGMVVIDRKGAWFKVEVSRLRLAEHGEEARVLLTRSQLRTRAILATE